MIGKITDSIIIYAAVMTEVILVKKIRKKAEQKGIEICYSFIGKTKPHSI